VVLQNMVCDHNYTTLANEQGPGRIQPLLKLPASSSPLERARSIRAGAVGQITTYSNAFLGFQ
jgi:hypothetical protein